MDTSYEEIILRNLLNARKTKPVIEWDFFLSFITGWQKNEFLQIFLRVLEPSELYFLSGLLAVSIVFKFFLFLTAFTKLNIFTFLLEFLCFSGQTVSRFYCSSS